MYDQVEMFLKDRIPTSKHMDATIVIADNILCCSFASSAPFPIMFVVTLSLMCCGLNYHITCPWIAWRNSGNNMEDPPLEFILEDDLPK